MAATGTEFEGAGVGAAAEGVNGVQTSSGGETADEVSLLGHWAAVMVS